MQTVEILYNTLIELQEQMNGMDRRYKAYDELRATWRKVYEIYHVEFQKEAAKKRVTA